MVSETSLPINQEVVGLSTKAGISCGDFISKNCQDMMELQICFRALFLGDCDDYKALSLPPHCAEWMLWQPSH